MSAERKLETEDGAIVTAEAALEPHVLRQQVAERLAAHRSRRPRSSEQVEAQQANPKQRASKIAAAVAERYAQTKSYQAYLAEEAERAVREAEEAARQAQAAAEIAARNAEAMAKVQYELLTELEEYSEKAPAPDARQHTPAAHRSRAQWTTEEPELEFEPASVPAEPPVYTVRHVADLRLPSHSESAMSRHSQSEAEVEEAVDPTDAYSLDEEIVFRQDPVFEPVEPPTPIPGNIIEFPRELIAPRKARPRLAEGPLLDEPGHSDPSQLRIFEVEAEQISDEPASDTAAPEWTSILLDAHPRQQTGRYGVQAQPLSAAYAEASYAPGNDAYAAQHLQLSPETEHLYSTPLDVAPVSLRLMSAMVDLCIVIAAFVVFAGVAVMTASHLIPGGIQMGVPTAAISMVGSVALLGLLYQMLFFSFSDATPGMRYARIGLCTMTDENPSRAAMRRRIVALVLSSASLGMGVLWALLDDDRLGWHDRISRMYQRSY